MDLSYLINVGVQTGNSEVISIGAGEKIVGLGEYGDKEVEWGRGYTTSHGWVFIMSFRSLTTNNVSKISLAFLSALKAIPTRVHDRSHLAAMCD